MEQCKSDIFAPPKDVLEGALNSVRRQKILQERLEMPGIDKDDPYEVAAVPTWYNGILFRSKTEAQWAVFFDAVGIRWTYEVQRYKCLRFAGEERLTYLADFYFPDYGIYAEVKGTDKQLRIKKVEEKIARALDYEATPIASGLILLGPIPHSETLENISSIAGCFLFGTVGAKCIAMNHYCIKQNSNSVKLDFDYDETIDSVNRVGELPKDATVSLQVIHEQKRPEPEWANDGALNWDGFIEDPRMSSTDYNDLTSALMLARSARFDFMDSIAKMRKEGRQVIGGR